MRVSWSKVAQGAGLLLGVGWIAFQCWILWQPLAPTAQRFAHLALALAILLLAPGGGRQMPRPRSRLQLALDLFLGAALLGVTLYYVSSLPRLDLRMEAVDPIGAADLLCAMVLIGLVLELIRRVIGWPLLGVILLFLVFGFIGRLLPGWTQSRWVPELFKFSGFTLAEAMESFALTPNGLLGITTATSVNFVFYFVTFGAVYAVIGGGRLFIDLGLRLAGTRAGGAAKAAVLASSLMGSISGSAVANVASTGVFTIPLMRRAGYSATHAAAVEAIASTGGQLMPPVMGVAAFIMAELLQQPYGKIALAALIPALAFYLAILLAVDLRARKACAAAAPPPGDALITPRAPLRGRLHLLLPPVLLVALLAAGWSANLAVVSASLCCLVMSCCWPSLRQSWRDWAKAIIEATRQAAEVAVPIAAIGLIIEVAVQSNLALKFSIMLLDISGTTLLGAMAWIVLGCLVMGLGLPTAAAYIIGAVLFVPALQDLGIAPLAAHFFVMYYCVLSMVTPPVALASYTAAGLARANSLATSLAAFRLGLVAFFIPFAFAFNPALLAQGPWFGIAGASFILLLGTAAWVAALEGYWSRLLTAAERGCLGLTGITLLWAPVIVDKITAMTAWNRWTIRGLVWGSLLLVLTLLATRIVARR